MAKNRSYDEPNEEAACIILANPRGEPQGIQGGRMCRPELYRRTKAALQLLEDPDRLRRKLEAARSGDGTEKSEAINHAETAQFSRRRLEQARSVLRHSRDLTDSVCGLSLHPGGGGGLEEFKRRTI
jgi:hypothetical protein